MNVFRSRGADRARVSRDRGVPTMPIVLARRSARSAKAGWGHAATAARGERRRLPPRPAGRHRRFVPTSMADPDRLDGETPPSGASRMANHRRDDARDGDEADRFLIWRGEKVRDFELKGVRLNGTNSGIQYRSTGLPSVGKWVLKGYQAASTSEASTTGTFTTSAAVGRAGARGAVAPGQVTRIGRVRYKVVADRRSETACAAS